MSKHYDDLWTCYACQLSQPKCVSCHLRLPGGVTVETVAVCEDCRKKPENVGRFVEEK